MVLVQFLRALGVDGTTMLRGPDEREALYRTQLAGRRVLVVLDNAAGEAQVRAFTQALQLCRTVGMPTWKARIQAGLEGALRTPDP